MIVLIFFRFLGGFPNTYTFTKRLAEQVIVDFSSTLPSVLFRPSIGKFCSHENSSQFIIYIR